MRAALALLAAAGLAAAAPAPRSPKVVDRCASPRRFVGKWAGVMSCKTGRYPATVTVDEGIEGACVRAAWAGDKPRPGGDGVLRVDPTDRSETFLMTASPMTSILRVYQRGGRLTFSQDPNASAAGKLIRFSGSAELNPNLDKALVRYTYSTPVHPADPCAGTMSRQ